MRLVTYNVNGIRAAIKKGLLDWISEVDADILCFQETKSQADQVEPQQFIDLGYDHAYWHSAEKKGYSGVLTISKKKAKKVVEGIEMKKYDSEGRVLRTDFGSYTVLNCYFPSGSSGDARHDFKMDFLHDFLPWVNNLMEERKKLIIVGDYNVVSLDLDIHNPQRRDKPSGFKPEERAWMKSWFDGDFKDAYRILYPEVKDQYSWWSYRSGARKNNKGWRIDYISVTNNLKKKVTEVRHGHEAVHSDHAPVIMDIKL